MKSERRHELQQNELAQQVDKLAESALPYGPMLLGAAAVVLVGGLIWAYVSGSRLAQREQGWSQFQDAQTAQDIGQLELVAKQNQGTLAGYWALQTAADIQAGRGAEMAFTDKDQALASLDDASKKYKQVTTASAADKLLSQRAWLGYAKAEESLYGVTGETAHLDNAKEAFEKIIATWPESSVSNVASSRIEFLAMNDSKEFYNWLAEYKPTPPPINNGGQGGQGMFSPQGNAPASDGGLQLPADMQLPDFDLGSDDDAAAADIELTPPAETPATEAPAPEAPAEQAPPAEEPASEEPASDAPAADEPTAETPADEASVTEEPVSEPAADEEPTPEQPAADEAAETEEPAADDKADAGGNE